MLLALTPSASQAQERLWHVNFGGGPTFIMGDLGDNFGTGWGPAIGVTFDAPSHRVAFQFEYAYRWFNVNDELPIGATRFSANHQTHQLAFNFIGNMTGPDSPVRVYGVAGPGMYYRKVEITEYEGTGLICGWYVCGAYPVTSVVGSRGGWDFGFNVGAGIGFKMGDDAEFFVESRYHYVAGPDVEVRPRLPMPAATTTHDTTGQLLATHVRVPFLTVAHTRKVQFNEEIADGMGRGDRGRRDDDGRRGRGAVQDPERCG